MNNLGVANRLNSGFLNFVRENQSALQTLKNTSPRAPGNRPIDFLQPVICRVF